MERLSLIQSARLLGVSETSFRKIVGTLIQPAEYRPLGHTRKAMYFDQDDVEALRGKNITKPRTVTKERAPKEPKPKISEAEKRRLVRHQKALNYLHETLSSIRFAVRKMDWPDFLSEQTVNALKAAEVLLTRDLDRAVYVPGGAREQDRHQVRQELEAPGHFHGLSS